MHTGAHRSSWGHAGEPTPPTAFVQLSPPQQQPATRNEKTNKWRVWCTLVHTDCHGATLVSRLHPRPSVLRPPFRRVTAWVLRCTNTRPNETVGAAASSRSCRGRRHHRPHHSPTPIPPPLGSPPPSALLPPMTNTEPRPKPPSPPHRPPSTLSTPPWRVSLAADLATASITTAPTTTIATTPLVTASTTEGTGSDYTGSMIGFLATDISPATPQLFLIHLGPTVDTTR